jgi:hypothetical protein
MKTLINMPHLMHLTSLLTTEQNLFCGLVARNLIHPLGCHSYLYGYERLDILNVCIIEHDQNTTCELLEQDNIIKRKLIYIIQN